MSIHLKNNEVKELRLRSIVLAVILTMMLALSNAFLALKLGILTSASIPAAIISMGVLRFFKNSNNLENNAVQTAASAGEAIAGGIVYTIPALIIIGYWHHFDYWTNFFIAASGGILGVLFSIPLRRILVHEPILKFPEGRAIAEVLKSSAERVGLQNIMWGGIIGAMLELFQVGFKLIASTYHHWMMIGRSLFGFGAGFSATMIGAGYLVGYEMATSIFLGAVISWGIVLPICSLFYPEFVVHHTPEEASMLLWNHEMRYLGIGAMLFAGCWTLIQLIKPLANTMRLPLREMFVIQKVARTERDIPFPWISLGVLAIAIGLYIFFRTIFPVAQVGLSGAYAFGIPLGMVFYVLIIGFFFSVITAYFSGMVGVTASPGSSVVIAGILFAAWLLLTVMNTVIPLPFSVSQLQAAEAMTIIIGSVVTGIAAIANDNTQDLKVGQLLGATPWKQQLMLLLGVIISSLVIPPVMQLLFDVYGIAGVMPHPGMDVSQSLPAPTAALLAAVTEAVFSHSLPWTMMFLGALVIFSVQLGYRFLKVQRYIQISLLGVAIGMYLPLASSFPLFVGGLIAKYVEKTLAQRRLRKEQENQKKQIGTLIACGLVAGSALVDVFLAIPFSIMGNPDALKLVGEGWYIYSQGLGICMIVWLAYWIKSRVLTL